MHTSAQKLPEIKAPSILVYPSNTVPIWCHAQDKN